MHKLLMSIHKVLVELLINGNDQQPIAPFYGEFPVDVTNAWHPNREGIAPRRKTLALATMRPNVELAIRIGVARHRQGDIHHFAKMIVKADTGILGRWYWCWWWRDRDNWYRLATPFQQRIVRWAGDPAGLA